MSHDPLQRVKHYLTQKEFGKARAVLQMSDHPKRDEWLARVDVLERQHAIESLPKPSNPYLLVWLTVFTPLVSTIALAYNWRRFEKKSWMGWTILAFVLLVPAVIFGVFGILLFTRTYILDVQIKAIIEYFSICIGLYILIDYPFFIAGRQNKAYKLIKEKNLYAAYQHQYDWGRGFAMAMLWLVFICGVWGVLMFNDREEFSDGWINLTVPFSWEFNDPFDCKHFNDEEECHLVVSARFSKLNIIFFEDGWAEEYETSQDMADHMWEGTHEDDEFTPLDRETITIGSHKAFVVRYIRNNWYMAQIFIKEGDDTFRILYESNNEALFDANWNNALHMIENAEWTP